MRILKEVMEDATRLRVRNASIQANKYHSLRAYGLTSYEATVGSHLSWDKYAALLDELENRGDTKRND